jgi:IS5 family transposase
LAEEMLYGSDAMRRFAGIKLGDDRFPDETTILNFRHLLEKHQLTEKLFAEVNGHLADQGITLRSATLVDATIIEAPSSKKNEAKARDPEMSSTKKGNAWFFGMKAHIGVDADSGIVHSLDTTTAKVHDARVWDDLLHGDETSIWADKGYVSSAREAAFSGPEKFWGVLRKAPKGGALHSVDAETNRISAMVRARVEHPFRVLKRQTLQTMLQTVLRRFPIQRVILVADRGLLSLDNIDQLTGLADKGDRRLEFILAVPARRYAELVETSQRLSFDETGLAESTFAGHRLIVSHDPLRAAEQPRRRQPRAAGPSEPDPGR